MHVDSRGLGEMIHYVLWLLGPSPLILSLACIPTFRVSVAVPDPRPSPEEISGAKQPGDQMR